MGEIAALGTAFFWSLNSIIFTAASHRIGSFSMSHYRMLFGTVLIAIAHFIVNGSALPSGVPQADWALLAASGLAGFFVCDALLFQSYVDASPRLGILVFSFYPFVSAILARVFLGETLPVSAWLGIAVTVSGIVIAILEKREGHMHLNKGHFKRGVLLAAGAACFQGLSFVLAKPAMTGDFATDPLTATLIRAIFGGAAYWLVSLVRGRLGIVIRRGRDWRSILFIFSGSVVGPFCGVWLSMIAVKMAPVGIASTLMAMMPVLILPMTAIIHKEKITARSLIGAAVACLGVAILFNA